MYKDRILDGRFKDIVRKWKPLRYDHILPLCGITYVFGPVPAIVSPSMPSGSLSTYLDEYYDGLSVAHKFGLLAKVATGLQYRMLSLCCVITWPLQTRISKGPNQRVVVGDDAEVLVQPLSTATAITKERKKSKEALTTYDAAAALKDPRCMLTSSQLKPGPYMWSTQGSQAEMMRARVSASAI